MAESNEVNLSWNLTPKAKDEDINKMDRALNARKAYANKYKN